MKTSSISQKSKRRGHPTFREIVDNEREKSTERIWERASLASALRHFVAGQGKRKAAALLGTIKANALRRAAATLPERIRVGIDSNYQIGLVSVEWPGHGRLHLPPRTVMRD